MLVLVFPRNPYRPGWGDSGNRMLAHLVPLLFFYFLLVYGRSREKSDLSDRSGPPGQAAWRPAPDRG
jgi:hypothetical protein